MEKVDYLQEIGKNEKLINSLYHAASCRYNLPEASLWILYFINSATEPITQHDIVERLLFPKQTIGAATASLVRKGYVKLQKLEGSKKKQLLLTEEGKRVVEKTVNHVFCAEKQAIKSMGNDKIKQFVELYGEFYEHMKIAFQNEGIVDE